MVGCDERGEQLRHHIVSRPLVERQQTDVVFFLYHLFIGHAHTHVELRLYALGTIHQGIQFRFNLEIVQLYALSLRDKVEHHLVRFNLLSPHAYPYLPPVGSVFILHHALNTGCHAITQHSIVHTRQIVEQQLAAAFPVPQYLAFHMSFSC